jgi:hypothetical protein
VIEAKMETAEDSPFWARLLAGLGALAAVALLLLGGWIWTSSFLAFSLGSVVDLARYASVGLWPQHPGYVERWGVKNEGNGRYSSWAEYLYEVDGEVYRGRQVAVAVRHYGSEDSALNALLPFPVGQPRNVSVSPWDVSDAVLEASHQPWGPLVLRLALAALLLGMMVAVLLAMQVRGYAIALAACAMLGFGAFCRSQTVVNQARRESLNPAQMRQRLEAVQLRRATWTGLKKGVLASELGRLGQPDRIVNSPGGGQTWYYDLDAGMEVPGKLLLLPSTRGLVVERAFPAYRSSWEGVASRSKS